MVHRSSFIVREGSPPGPVCGPSSGGSGTAPLATARSQHDAGIDASVWCTDPADVASRAAPGFEVVTFPVTGHRRFAFSRAAEHRARTAPADIVHQHGLWTAQGRVTGVFRSRGITTVVAPHGMLAPYALSRSPWKKRAALAWFESRNLHQASCLHAASEAEVTTFRKFGLRVPAAVIPNAVSPEWLSARGDRSAFRRRHGIDEGARVMLFLSRIHPIKGLPMLLAALARHRDQLHDWRLLIAGPDEAGHRAEVERLALQLGVTDMILFPGALYEADKRDAFAAADLFVLPTHTENFGIVIAEALASSVPVITTHGAPWRELEEHRCGWWVAPDSVSIGAALTDAASRPLEDLRAMGIRGQALVASRYVWPLVAERTIGLYKWLRDEAERPAFVVVD